MRFEDAWNRARPWPVYLLAAALPISMAVVSAAKLLLVLVAGGVLAGAVARQRSLPGLGSLRSAPVVLAMLGVLAMSLAWTSAPLPQALQDFAKYVKLLFVLLIPVLLREPREARTAMLAYLWASAFVVGTSCLLAAGVTPPWVGKEQRTAVAVVFSGQLDQTIMTAGLAVVAWHLRGELGSRAARIGAVLLAVVSAGNALFLMPGRTGHMALLVGASLAVAWALPRRMRWAALLAPVALAGLALAVSAQFRDRIAQVVSESRQYRQGDTELLSSSGIRLNLWERSVQIIAQHPWTGTGVGSWPVEYARLEGEHLKRHLAPVRNPHQEYLLWAVQAGFGGLILLLAFLAALAADAWRFAQALRRTALSLTAILAVTCLFNSILFDALIGDYFCVLLGILMAWGLRRPAQGAPA